MKYWTRYSLSIIALLTYGNYRPPCVCFTAPSTKLTTTSAKEIPEDKWYQPVLLHKHTHTNNSCYIHLQLYIKFGHHWFQPLEHGKSAKAPPFLDSFKLNPGSTINYHQLYPLKLPENAWLSSIEEEMYLLWSWIVDDGPMANNIWQVRKVGIEE